MRKTHLCCRSSTCFAVRCSNSQSAFRIRRWPDYPWSHVNAPWHLEIHPKEFRWDFRGQQQVAQSRFACDCCCVPDILKQNIISVGLIHVHQVALPPSSTSTKWHFHEALVRMVPYVKFVPNLRQALVRCEVRFSISSFFEPPIYHVGEDSCRTWKSHSRISSNKHQQPKGLDTRTSTGHGSKTPYISCFPVELPATQHFEAGEPLWAWVKIKPPEKNRRFWPMCRIPFCCPTAFCSAEAEPIGSIQAEETLPPFQVVFLRFSTAALVLLPLLVIQGRSSSAERKGEETFAPWR